MLPKRLDLPVLERLLLAMSARTVDQLLLLETDLDLVLKSLFDTLLNQSPDFLFCVDFFYLFYRPHSYGRPVRTVRRNRQLSLALPVRLHLRLRQLVLLSMPSDGLDRDLHDGHDVLVHHDHPLRLVLRRTFLDIRNFDILVRRALLELLHGQRRRVRPVLGLPVVELLVLPERLRMRLLVDLLLAMSPVFILHEYVDQLVSE